MTLNKQAGEVLDGLGAGFIIEPNTKWRTTQLWDIASKLAVEAFYNASRQPGIFAFAPKGFTDDQVLVQRYPEDARAGSPARLAIIFQARIAGQDYYHPVVFRLPPETLAALKLAGLWTDQTVH